MARLSVDCLHRRYTLRSDVLHKVFAELVNCLGLASDSYVELIVCTDVRIARMHFGKRGSTDVISFLTDFPELSIEGAPHYLGEIFLCADQVCRNARSFNVSIGDEFLFCFIHGLLHLIGWTDDTKIEREAMHKKQRELQKFCQERHSQAEEVLQEITPRKAG